MMTEQAFDPTFLVNIGQKMQVPDRIELGERRAEPLGEEGYKPSLMHVPDRIVLAGNNQHIGLRNDVRPLRLDVDFDMNSHITLRTPPAKLTVQNSNFPVIDSASENGQSENENDDEEEDTMEPSAIHQDSESEESLCALDSEDQVSIHSFSDKPFVNRVQAPARATASTSQIEIQLNRLTKRLALLEIESQQRKQRDFFLFAAITAYIGFSAIRFLFRSS